MSNRVPEAQAKKIREIVYQEADKYNYLARTRTDNGQFFARLVAMPSVGGVLAGFIQRSEIRTYIKDAILNRYSKDKKRIERPRDLLAMCRICFGVEDLEDVEKSKEIHLMKSHNNPTYVVVAEGTYLKWETALRKALLYVASNPFGQIQGNTIHIALSLFARHVKIPATDKKLLERSLSVIPAKVFFWGE